MRLESNLAAAPVRLGGHPARVLTAHHVFPFVPAHKHEHAQRARMRLESNLAAAPVRLGGHPARVLTAHHVLSAVSCSAQRSAAPETGSVMPGRLAQPPFSAT